VWVATPGLCDGRACFDWESVTDGDATHISLFSDGCMSLDRAFIVVSALKCAVHQVCKV
jgi:hypothetical protein